MLEKGWPKQPKNKVCRGQLILATDLYSYQYLFSDSLGVCPPLYFSVWEYMLVEGSVLATFPCKIDGLEDI